MKIELLEQLERLKQKDTDSRSSLLNKGMLYGVYAQVMQDVHRDNAFALDEIISIHGWPGISEVGLEGCRVSWLIAQHSNCTPELQRKFFNYLSEAANIGNAPVKQVAMLTDRIRFNEGKPQIYGTLLDWNEKGEFTCEIEDPQKNNELREKVGLPPLEQATREHQKDVEAEGGKPPENYTAYKKAVLDWAKSVGWQ